MALNIGLCQKVHFLTYILNLFMCQGNKKKEIVMKKCKNKIRLLGTFVLSTSLLFGSNMNENLYINGAERQCVEQESSFVEDNEHFLENTDITDSGTYGDNLNWTLSREGTLTISGTGAMRDYHMYESPPWYGHVIKVVKIQSGVTRIGVLHFMVAEV